MALEPHQLARLQDGLDRQRRAIERRRLLSRWLRGFAPWVAPLLAVPLVARLVQLPGWPGLAPFGAVAIGSLLRAWRDRAAWEVPAWKPLAIADHRSGARGALLHAATGGGAAASVPAAALEVRLGPVSWWRPLLGVAAIALAAVLTMVVPLPHRPAPAAGGFTPAPVARVEALLRELERVSGGDPLAAEAKRTLDRLAAQRDGLSDEDFEALDRLERDAASRLAEEQARAQRSLAAADALGAMLAGGEREPAELQRRIGELRRAAESAGVDERTRSLLRRAEVELGAGDEPGSGLQESGERTEVTDAGQGSGDAPGAEGQGEGEAGQGEGVAGSGEGRGREALRAALDRQRRELSARIGAAGSALDEAGQGGIARGPGVAPLEYRHQDPLAAPGFQNQPITARSGGKVVALVRQRLPAEPIRDGPGAGAPAASGVDGTTWDRRLLPRQRRVLQEYFGTDR